MKSKREFRIHFLKDTEIKFINPETKRQEWYGSDYWRGTSILVSDIISGSPKTLRVRCLDGEIGILEMDAVRIEQVV